MKCTIITIFPEVVRTYLNTSIMKRANEAGVFTSEALDLRQFANDKHKTVDDTPYGGGAGMVLKIEPIDRALQTLKDKAPDEKRKIVVMSARGEQFRQAKAADYSTLDHLILISGRYEGIDQRVIDHLADEELSIGPYVLAGGELAALAVAEATARLVPGVLGNKASLADSLVATDSVSTEPHGAGFPQYTKPEEYNGWSVPEVLLSGNHADIDQWRNDNART